MNESKGAVVENQFFKLTDEEISGLCAAIFQTEEHNRKSLLDNGTRAEDKDYIKQFSDRLNEGATPERLLQNINESVDRLREHRPQPQ